MTEIDYLGPKTAGQYFSFFFLVIITISHILTLKSIHISFMQKWRIEQLLIIAPEAQKITFVRGAGS